MKFARRDGARVAVIRPDAPAMALAIANVALEKNDGELLGRLPEEVGEYTFVGWLSAFNAGGGPYILDNEGHAVGKPQPGDSFVHPSALQKKGTAS